MEKVFHLNIIHLQVRSYQNEIFKNTIGKELKNELNKRYNIERISTWACNLLVDLHNEHSLEFDNILRPISMMDAGPEFEYGEDELKLLIEMLINNEDDPI